MKTRPVKLEDVIECSALKSIIQQSIALGVRMAHDGSVGGGSIEKKVDKFMKQEGMELYILRLGRQIQNNISIKVDPENIF